jgi:hypothetical protein
MFKIYIDFISKSSNKPRYNSFGDLVDYKCGYNFSSYSIDLLKFNEINDVIVKEIINRVEKLKEISRTDKVLIRIPPIYTDGNRKKIISEKMNFRINSLKDAGIIVIGETICSSDKSMFCDSIHPNEKGRIFFSMELKNGIKKIENINQKK